MPSDGCPRCDVTPSQVSEGENMYLSCLSTGGIPPVSLAFVIGGVSLDGTTTHTVDGNVSHEYTLSAERALNGKKVKCVAGNNATSILSIRLACEISLNITCKFISITIESKYLYTINKYMIRFITIY